MRRDDLIPRGLDMNLLSLLPLPIASMYCDVLASDSDVVIPVFSVVINCLSA